MEIHANRLANLDGDTIPQGHEQTAAKDRSGLAGLRVFFLYQAKKASEYVDGKTPLGVAMVTSCDEQKA